MCLFPTINTLQHTSATTPNNYILTLLFLHRNDYMNRQTFRNRLVVLRSFLNLSGVVNPRGPLIGGLNTRLDLLDLVPGDTDDGNDSHVGSPCGE